ncbi:hypothetical protein KP509_24G070900 [Ceratopteris richardii]|uniref:Uncharacterized protein n=1 Tax=Ceratopteris richardii TaxID=49495 RepID=A0A8T2RYG2_CERRI|nr:hypothetical protein KP509_24G070900 [Ceratopteris richardii]
MKFPVLRYTEFVLIFSSFLEVHMVLLGGGRVFHFIGVVMTIPFSCHALRQHLVNWEHSISWLVTATATCQRQQPNSTDIFQLSIEKKE